MKGLIVVHTELTEEDREDFGDDHYHETKSLFERIGARMHDAIRDGWSVYFLPEDAKNADDPCIYPAVRQHLSHVHVIGIGVPYEPQFLMTKEKALEDELEETEIVGVAGDTCVADVHAAMTGNLPISERMDELEEAARRLGWSYERLQDVYFTRIKSWINPDLIDH